MCFRSRFLRRPKYSYEKDSSEKSPGRRKKGKASNTVLLLAAALLLFMAASAMFLDRLSTDIAVSDARDIMIMRINSAISDIMGSGEYSGSDFVSFEKSDTGEITAVNSNMRAINSLSAEILERVTQNADSQTITVEIPAGNLTGVSLLMGRGPMVPVKIVVLTSSSVKFNNSVVTAGINQTKHRISLDVIVDIDVLIPWGTESTQVSTEVLIADTVVVGQVPDTYLNMQ